MRWMFGVIVTMMVVGTSMALGQSKNGAYYCVVEAVGGLAYDATSKKWKGAVFRPDRKFVLRLRYVGRRESSELGNEGVDDYMATITESGKSDGNACTRYHAEKRWLVGVFGNGWMEECSVSLRDYVFHLGNGRFLSKYSVGYVNGIDDNSDTPSISGGTCTKIE